MGNLSTFCNPHCIRGIAEGKSIEFKDTCRNLKFALRKGELRKDPCGESTAEAFLWKTFRLKNLEPGFHKGLG